MNLIVIHDLHDLEVIINEPLYISKETVDLNTETEHNMWGISLDENAIHITTHDLLKFFDNLFKKRTLQLKTISPAMHATLYIWFDKQALQLRFNIISGNPTRLPFDCQINMVSSLRPIVETFIQTSQQVAQYGDHIEIENFNDDDWEDDDREELIILDIFILILNQECKIPDTQKCIIPYLTIRQAFDAMTDFLTTYWKKTGSDEIACLLSGMDTGIWADGSTGDPAIWGEWIGCIDEVTNTENADRLTVLQAFQAMGKLLEQYIPFNTPSEAVDVLKSGVQVYKDGSIANPAFWADWVRCINEIAEKQNTPS